ncbi:tryptophan synthase subunit alpha [Neisseria shayeganii]|uniref:Tryptophan synthase alpha chain n=1 Tax=Neisseria shayeganii TaxID=607712 RepID=A0A7D7N7Y2_9NEIS|nr:tryptophan synthase subunit alpha [Neisseria shayeganii]QMT39637.1 tryptophan synthase subunit alpha [Neisseria shayeganii]
MTTIQHTFQQLNGRPALITYITAGDPDLDTTLQLMHSLADNGADIIELGVPFSDPMADGPTIQRAAERALAQGVSLRDVLALTARFRERNRHTPVVLMGYLNPIHKMGYADFARAAAEAGVNGVLTVDSPIETIAPLHRELRAQDLDTIFLVAPTTGEARMAEIGRLAGGFVYYVSLKGVTGSAALDTADVAAKLAVLRRHIHIPIGVGFGINDADSARQIAAVADAVIIGSRIVKEIETHPGREAAAVGALVHGLKAAIAGALPPKADSRASARDAE